MSPGFPFAHKTRICISKIILNSVALIICMCTRIRERVRVCVCVAKRNNIVTSV